MVPMFEGLRFCIFINGWDILGSSSLNLLDEANEVTSTLHIFNESNVRAQMLFQRYSGTNNDSLAQNYLVDDNTREFQISNAIGKYLVARKKDLQSDQKFKSAVLFELRKDETTVINCDYNTQSPLNNDLLSDEEEVMLDVGKICKRITQLENKAISLLNSLITTNPPKALIAVIDPNGDGSGSLGDGRNTQKKLPSRYVGLWEGPKDAFRSSEFKKSGGAPCPKDFTFSSKYRSPLRSQRQIETEIITKFD